MKKNKKTNWFRQCVFETPCEGGKTVSIAWIPEHLAVVGKQIYFGKKTDAPEKMWTVTSVGDKQMDGDYLAEHERDYKTQRQASDI